MFRWSIVSLVSLMITASPVSCCCTLNNLFQWTSPQISFEAKPSSTSCESCCCQKKESSSKSEENSPSPDHRCKCSNGKDIATSLTRDHSKSLSSGNDYFLFPNTPMLQLFSYAGDLHRPVKGIGVRQSIAFPFSSGTDVLRALHILRC